MADHVLYNKSNTEKYCRRGDRTLRVPPGKNIISSGDKNYFSAFIERNKDLILDPKRLNGIAVEDKKPESPTNAGEGDKTNKTVDPTPSVPTTSPRAEKPPEIVSLDEQEALHAEGVDHVETTKAK